jgi:hypothetical protein
MPGFSEGPSKVEVTQLLKAWGTGDDKALEQLTLVVENELCRLARCCMAAEWPGQTIQITALVNEVYLCLVDINALDWQDRAHFFAITACLVRSILTDFRVPGIIRSKGRVRSKFLSTKRSSLLSKMGRRYGAR